MAIIDTGFCKQHRISPRFKIKAFLDATKEVGEIECDKDSIKLSRFHGENVLKVITENTVLENSIDLYLISVFDKNGNQELKFWQSALEYINQNKIDLVFSAVGIPVPKNSIPPVFPKNSFWVVSAARISPGIKSDDVVFPQSASKEKNLVLVGDYYEGFKLDYGLLNKKDIKVFESDYQKSISPNPHFQGTSFSAAYFYSKFLSKCGQNNEMTRFASCFYDHLKKINSDIIVFE